MNQTVFYRESFNFSQKQKQNDIENKNIKRNRTLEEQKDEEIDEDKEEHEEEVEVTDIHRETKKMNKNIIDDVEKWLSVIESEECIDNIASADQKLDAQTML